MRHADTYGAFAHAVVAASGPRFGQAWIGDKSAYQLANYMDEVDKEVGEFDVFMRDLEHNPKPKDTCSHGFFGAWNQFINAQEAGVGSTGKPDGWRAFYRDNRGLFDRWLSDDPLWAMTESYEDELIRFYDWAVSCGAKPPTKRPERAHQKPPPSETPEGQIASAVKWAVIIGGVVAAGYLLRSVPASGGNRR